MAKPRGLLSEICSLPGSDEALRFDRKARATSSEGRHFRALNGVPILRDETSPLEQFSASHVSSGIEQDQINYMCGLPGYSLMLGAGNATFSHPRVIDSEFNLYASTDVVADAHCLPFRSGTFELFFAMNVFEHLRQPFQAASEALRVLKPGGELHIHTAFLQPLHEEPVHFFNATEFGGREWLKDFDHVECSVSSNFNPLYAAAWFSDELLGSVHKHLGPAAAGTIGQLSLAELAGFWTQPEGWNSEAAEIFFKLPEQAQRRIAAGFDFRARKPLAGE